MSLFKQSFQQLRLLMEGMPRVAFSIQKTQSAVQVPILPPLVSQQALVEHLHQTRNSKCSTPPAAFQSFSNSQMHRIWSSSVLLFLPKTTMKMRYNPYHQMHSPGSVRFSPKPSSLLCSSNNSNWPPNSNRLRPRWVCHPNQLPPNSKCRTRAMKVASGMATLEILPLHR